MSYEKGDRDRADPCKIYVGGNPEMEEDELRGLFAKHGTVEKVWIARSPPGFAFVWLTDERDVADAIKALDGAELGRHKVTVRGDWRQGLATPIQPLLQLGSDRKSRPETLDQCFSCCQRKLPTPRRPHPTTTGPNPPQLRLGDGVKRTDHTDESGSREVKPAGERSGIGNQIPHKPSF